MGRQKMDDQAKMKERSVGLSEIQLASFRLELGILVRILASRALYEGTQLLRMSRTRKQQFDLSELPKLDIELNLKLLSRQIWKEIRYSLATQHQFSVSYPPIPSITVALIRPGSISSIILYDWMRGLYPFSVSFIESLSTERSSTSSAVSMIMLITP